MQELLGGKKIVAVRVGDPVVLRAERSVDELLVGRTLPKAIPPPRRTSMLSCRAVRELGWHAAHPSPLYALPT